MITTPMTPAASLSLVLSLLPRPQGAESAPHIEWQRTLTDALAVQQATGQPLLIVVNSAGEVFNDRFRTQTYGSAAFRELTRGYVCLIASPDRHNERDHDALGNRIECPAFPGCTCGEHIAIEPELFERYFKGDRWAPRHIGVSPAGEILFDRYQDRSMQTAIDAVTKHRGRPEAAAVPKSVTALLQRRDAAARRALESMYRTSRDAAILTAAGEADNAPFGVIRMALRAEHDDECERGAATLAKISTPTELADLQDALARSRNAAPLLAAIERLAKNDEAAARLLAHVDTDDATIGSYWQVDWQDPDYEIWQREAVEAELDRCEQILRDEPHDHTTRLRQAIAQLAFAHVLMATGGKGVDFWLEDARNTAARIPDADLQPAAWAVEATATWLRNDAARTEPAVAKALAGRRGAVAPNAWLATRFFEVIAQLDTRAAYARASDPKAVLQPEVARTRAVVRALTGSRWTAEAPLLTAIGLLEYAGLRGAARDFLDAAVQRFGSSATVHERWRARVMADHGAETMRRAAAELAAPAADRATGAWFAGYAALVAAEQHVRDERRALAVTAYTDSIERLASSVERNAAYADSANHFAALALSGRAHLHHAAGDGKAAVADLLRGNELRAATADSKDGLGRTPRGIATRIKQALEADGRDELAAQLREIAW